MISSIKISSISSDYKMKYDETEIANLSRLNIFIWSNNAGKSRFMRELVKKKMWGFKNKFYDWEKNELYDLTTIVNKFRSLLDQCNKHGELDQLIKEIWPFDDFYFWRNDDWSYFSDMINDRINRLGSEHLENIIDPITWLNLLDSLGNRLPFFSGWAHYQVKYIPILRDMKPLWPDTNHPQMDILKGRVCRDYEMEPRDVHNAPEMFVHGGVPFNEKIGDHDILKKFAEFLSERVFDGKKVSFLDVINDTNDVIYIQIGDDPPRAIYDLWDWVWSMILMLEYIFIQYQYFRSCNIKYIIFIEEPETHLHPGMQRKLLQIFLSEEFSNIQFFITTHSNHFLDMTLDQENISVYAFEKKWDIFEIDNIANDNTKSLELLWVRNSAVFLANCSIWVEWITDRIYLRKIIELIQEWKDIKFNEDYHFTFIEYSWSNITHWWLMDKEDKKESDINFERISQKIFLISDRDNPRPNSEKAKRIPKLQKTLWDNFYLLECREIENLLSPQVLNKILIEDWVPLPEYELSEWVGNYKFEYLGEYLFKKYGTGKYVTLNPDWTTIKWSGTIKWKVDFARWAVKHIQSIEDLSEEARDLWEKLYSFIQCHNS